MNKTILLGTISVLILSFGLSTCTPQSSFSLSEASVLYSGPGNISYDVLAELPAGTVVTLSGSYGDFMSVSLDWQGDTLTGFIRKAAIQDEPDKMDALDPLEFNWEPMYLPECAPAGYDPLTDTVTFDNSLNATFFGTESAAWNLDKPVRIAVGKMAATGEGGSVKVLGRPEGDVDPSTWWRGVLAMALEVRNGNYWLAVMDGSSEKSIRVDTGRSASLPIQILFDQPEGRGFSVLDEKNLVLQHIDLTVMAGVNLPEGLFPERKFYFGVDTNAGSSLAVTGLQFGTQPDGRWVEPPAGEPGLAELAEARGLTFGTIFDLPKMIDRRYCQIMKRDFNEIVITEFTIIARPFWLGRGQYDYTYIDRSVELAELRGWRVDGSHLVWGDYGAIPDWLRNGTFTRAEYISILEEHIRSVVGHYRGRVHEWSIANESPERITATHNDPYTTFRDFWYDRIGPDYIEMAFEWAHDADPDAILVLNTGLKPPFGASNQAELEVMRSIVKDLKTDNVPLDAVGWQMHLLGPLDIQTPPEKAQTIALIQEFQAMGVTSYFTELEVDLGSRLTSQAESYDYQAWVYREMVDACLESDACDGIYLWGFADSLSWIICSQPAPICLGEPNGDPLIYDRDFEPKPAYTAVSAGLAGLPNVFTPPDYTPFMATTVLTAPPPDAAATLNLYDDFEAADSGRTYDRSKWRLTGSSRGPEIYLENGSLVLLDGSQELSGDITLIARAYEGVLLSDPLSIEAGLTLPAGSAPGSISIKITAAIPSRGTWFAGCGIERYSSQFRSSCGDFIWSTQMENDYHPPIVTFEPGSRHIFRIEIDPQNMRITYRIDGVEVGSHALESSDLLGSTRFTFSLSTWKTSINQPLHGAVDYVSIGPVGN
jgi:endo-1,4-beta-xylanase